MPTIMEDPRRVSNLFTRAKHEKVLSAKGQQPDNSRLKVALRQLDKQVDSNLSLLGFTPSDRSRLGFVQVKTRSKLQERMAKKHGPGWDR